MSEPIEQRVRELVVVTAARGYGISLTPTSYSFDSDRGDRINLVNIVDECRRTDPARWPQVVFEFVASFAGVASTASGRTMNDAEFLHRARARILPSNYFDQVESASGGYCRKLVSDTVDHVPLIGLCLDYPDTIETITDKHLAGRDVDAVWAAAIPATGTEQG